MPLQPCRYSTCPALVRVGGGGYCPTHRIEVDRLYRRRGRRAAYGTLRWKLASRQFLVRNPECDCGEMATEVDHIIPVEDGGGMWDRANWQGKCHRCHASKTNQDVRRRTFR